MLRFDGGCSCACHTAEKRTVEEVEAELRARLTRGKLTCDRAAEPQGPSFFILKYDGEPGRNASEIVIEYEPSVGFGLTLVGWYEDRDRTYAIDSVVKKVEYWLDGCY